MDATYNIVLTTTGGSESAAEVGKATQALNNVTSASSGLQTKFQERFQHIGLQLFASQALSTIGLSGEVRQAVLLMNTAITGAEAAAGIASGGLTLLITALAAIGVVIYKVVSAHKDLADVLVKQSDADAKALVATEDKIGKLPPQLAALLAAEQRVAQDQQSALTEAVKKATVALNEQLAAIKANASSVGPLTAVYNALLISLGGTAVGYKTLTGAVYMSQDAFLKTKKAIDDNIASQKELQFQATHAGLTAVEYAQKQVEAQQKVDASIAKTAEYTKRQADEAMKASKTTSAAWMMTGKDYDKMTQDIKSSTKSTTKEIVKVWSEGAKQMADTMGAGFYDMLKNGTSFADAMSQQFEKLFEKIMQEILQLIMEWAIFSAMSGMGGSIGAAGLSGLAGMPHFATGGQAFADTPTLALFGEGGPEVATFTPLSGGGDMGGGGGGNGGGTMVNNINVQVTGVIDQSMVNKIGLQIVQSIRGAGQIGFVRT